MLLTVCVTVGCERGPSPGEQDALGAAVWEAQCGTCHTEGGIGARITPPGLAAYGTVGGLVSYTRMAMPYGLGGTLPDDEYLAVAAFLLHEHGLLPDDVAVGPSSTEPLRLEP
jgi:mono/diheme cytochrome c family protein